MVGVASQVGAPARSMPAKGTTYGKSFLGIAPDIEAADMSVTAPVATTDAVLQEPPLYMLPFGKVWSQDALAFHHNAMRRELQDMYYLVSSMKRRVFDLSQQDFDDFYEWFCVLEQFVHDFFDLEDKVFFPWLATKVPVNEMAHLRSPRNEQKAAILSGLEEIRNCQARFTMLPVSEVLPILVHGVDRFAPPFVSYMSDREQDTMPLVARYFTSLEKATYDNSLLDWVKSSPRSFLLWHLLIRAVPKRSGEHAALRKKYVSSEPGFLARMKLRKQYKMSQVEIRDSHYGIVVQFYRRWGKAVEDETGEPAAPANHRGPDAVPALRVIDHDETVDAEDQEAEFVVIDDLPNVQQPDEHGNAAVNAQAADSVEDVISERDLEPEVTYTIQPAADATDGFTEEPAVEQVTELAPGSSSELEYEVVDVDDDLSLVHQEPRVDTEGPVFSGETSELQELASEDEFVPVEEVVEVVASKAPVPQ